MTVVYSPAKIFIFGKTYPELSVKHLETVCTGGVLEDGSPVRLFPIPYRYLDDDQRFKNYQWITARIGRYESDPRPESYRVERGSIRLGEIVPTTKDAWGKRADILFRNPSWQFDSVEALWQSQKDSGLSLGVVRPKEIIAVRMAPRSIQDKRTFQEKLDQVKRLHAAERAQLRLFEDEDEDAENSGFLRHTYVESRVEVHWRCFGANCKEHRMQILDWGTLELQRREGDEKALEKVRDICDLNAHDLRFFLGNLRLHPASFMIVGLWYPKRGAASLFW